MAKLKNVISIIDYVIKKYGKFHPITKKYTTHNRKMTHVVPEQGTYGRN